MAAKPSKPPELISSKNDENITTIVTKEDNLSLSNSCLDQLKPHLHQQNNNQCSKLTTKNDCVCCTNISIMQLFHEMKQKFPTVPDNIVNQCVINNCHNRESCIEILQHEFNIHASTSQSYPSNVFRNKNNINSTPQQQLSENVAVTHKPTVINLSKKSSINDNALKPSRPAPVPHKIKQTFDQGQGTSLLSGGINCNKSETKSNFNLSKNNLKQTNEKSTSPKRPTTLNIQDSHKKAFRNSGSFRLKPVRRAPPPPVSVISPSGENITSQSSSSGINTNFFSQKCYQNKQSPYKNYSYSSSIQSPFSDSESGISLNISLSPSSDQIPTTSGRKTTSPITTGQHAQPQTPRRVTSLNIQPEQASNKSYTTVNLTLRKPGSLPASPIDITSSRFDAERGVQQNVHISLHPDTGAIRSSNIRPKSLYMPSASHQEEEFKNVQSDKRLRSASSEMNFHQNNLGNTCDRISEMSVIDSPSKLKGKDALSSKLIEHQKVQKDKLIEAIEKNRKKLEQVENEIQILKIPLSPGESERLDEDIKTLRRSCELLFNEIDNFKRLTGNTTGQNGTLLNNVSDNSGSSNYNLRQKPPRPPPPLLRSTNVNFHIESNEQSDNGDGAPGTVFSNIELRTSSPSVSTPTSVTTPTNYNIAATINNLHPEEDGPQWPCKHCTFLNDPLMIRCENCDYDRDNNGTLNQHINSFDSGFQSNFPTNHNNINNNNNLNDISTTAVTTNSTVFVDSATNFENNNLKTAATAYTNCL